jgi:hypothetical protein
MSISDHYFDQINDPDNLAELDRQETPDKESSESIKTRMLKANKARTDILAIHPEINSQWTPNALEILEKEKDNE